MFSDVSGFTKLSEKLAEQGKAGAEELTQILLGTFTELLSEAHDEGGDLLSFGGDPSSLRSWVTDTRTERPERQCRCGCAQGAGPVQTGKGRVTLKISQGAHTGTFHLVLAGEHQHELLVIGPDATLVTDIEGAATAGQVVVSHATAAHLPDTVVRRDIGPRTTGPASPGRRRHVRSLVATEPDTSTLGPGSGPPGGRKMVERIPTPRIRRRLRPRLRVDEHLAEHGPDRTAEALSQVTTAFAEAADAADVCLLASDLAPDGAKSSSPLGHLKPSRTQRGDCSSPPAKHSTTTCRCRSASAPTWATCSPARW